MLGGMHAATSRYVVSATMAHLIIFQDGTRFKFPHNFLDLLVGQMEAALEGKPVDFCLQVNRHKKKKLHGRILYQMIIFIVHLVRNTERILRIFVLMKCRVAIKRNTLPSVKWAKYKKDVMN